MAASHARERGARYGMMGGISEDLQHESVQGGGNRFLPALRPGDPGLP